MRPRFVLVFAVVFAAAASAQTITITPNKVTYRRQKPLVDFKRIFTVTWPKVKASSPAISRKIESALNYEKVFDFTIKEEMREIQWLEAAAYEVEYNKNGILCVALSINGSGAYPDGSIKHIVINSRTGTRLAPATVFANLNGLAAMVMKDQQRAKEEGLKTIRKQEPDVEDPELLFGDKTFTIEDLNGFSVGSKGVTFHYDWGFPHVVQALEPSSEFAYTWNRIRPYLKPGGLLESIAR